MDTRTRTARCGCGRTRPSSPSLAFFEDLSEPNRWTICAHPGCYFVESVHQPINPGTGRPGVTDHAFTPRWYEFDAFYCGCRGWD